VVTEEIRIIKQETLYQDNRKDALSIPQELANSTQERIKGVKW
jgi:hypothetical protein